MPLADFPEDLLSSFPQGRGDPCRGEPVTPPARPPDQPTSYARFLGSMCLGRAPRRIPSFFSRGNGSRARAVSDPDVDLLAFSPFRELDAEVPFPFVGPSSRVTRIFSSGFLIAPAASFFA